MAKFINGITLSAAPQKRLDEIYPATIMSLDNAIDLASKLNAASDEDWRYMVDVDVRTGAAKVEVFDENGEFISHL